MTDDPKRVVVKLIETTDAVIAGLDREPVNARRYQRLVDELAKLTAEVRSARSIALIALGLTLVALGIAFCV